MATKITLLEEQTFLKMLFKVENAGDQLFIHLYDGSMRVK